MQTKLIIGGSQIRTNEAGLVSLTDIYAAAEAASLADGKLDPRRWAEKPRAKKSGSSGNVSISGGPGRRGLPAKTNMRDVMDLEQLTRTALAEILAKKRIERFNVRGNAPCAAECETAARSVAALN